jgi:hypothetical protein
LEELDEIKIKETNKVQTRNNELQSKLLMLSSLHAYAEELVKKGSACAILQSAKDLLARAKQLHADQVEFSKGSFSPDRVTFIPAPIELTNIFVGSIAVNGSIDYQQKLNKSKVVLKTRLECEYGLMDQLMSKRILLDCQLSIVKALQSHLSEQNDKLIEMLCLQEDFQPYADFLSALTQTNQSHLAKYIAYNEDLKAMKGDNRPLRDEEIDKLRVLRPFLVENISLTGLPDQLLAKGCISRMQFDSITQQAGDYSKIREMLDILQRRSVEHLKVFVSCLKSTHQEQIALEIERTGSEFWFFVFCFSYKKS